MDTINPTPSREMPTPSREMFDEINTLIGAVARALDMTDGQVVAAIEEGRLGMEMLTDAEGANFIRATCDDKSADIRQGAFMKRE